jgi:hydroxymethylpyrimidine pyrophosphatase-like HAD family hydrolase
MLDQLDLSAVCAVALDVDGTLAGPDSLVNDRTIRR